MHVLIKFPVPPELARYGALKFKTGTIHDRPPRLDDFVLVHLEASIV